MDRGNWITWYNLPAEGRDAYLSWLHGTYIPKLLKKPGFLYAAHYASAKVAPSPLIPHTSDRSVPTGCDYMLIFGAETAHAFSKGADAFIRGAPSKLHADLSETDRKMLSMRIGERVCITTEEARADGPEASQRQGKLVLGPCIQLGSFNVKSCDLEDEWLSWYADWRMSALGNLPECIGIRKLVSVSGWAKHIVIYEFTSLQARNENLPKLKDLYPEMITWKEKAVANLIHTAESPVVAERIWPTVSG